MTYYQILTPRVCVYIHPAVMWLCVWPSAGGVQCPARVHACDSLWGHTRTGKGKTLCLFSLVSIACPVCVRCSPLPWLLSHSTFSFMTFVNSSELAARFLTQITYSWSVLLTYLHFFIHSVLRMFWQRVVSNPRPSAGRLCWPRVLQSGDIHLPAGAESQMARPHHASPWKPREPTDHPGLRLLWWDLIHGCHMTTFSPTSLSGLSSLRWVWHQWAPLCLADECQTKYGNANAWRYCTKVFDMLTVAAVSTLYSFVVLSKPRWRRWPPKWQFFVL